MEAHNNNNDDNDDNDNNDNNDNNDDDDDDNNSSSSDNSNKNEPAEDAPGAPVASRNRQRPKRVCPGCGKETPRTASLQDRAGATASGTPTGAGRPAIDPQRSGTSRKLIVRYLRFSPRFCQCKRLGDARKTRRNSQWLLQCSETYTASSR